MHGYSLIVIGIKSEDELKRFLDPFFQKTSDYPVELLVPLEKPHAFLTVIRPYLTKGKIRLLLNRQLSSVVSASRIEGGAFYDHIGVVNVAEPAPISLLQKFSRYLSKAKPGQAVTGAKGTTLSSVMFHRAAMPPIADMLGNTSIADIILHVGAHCMNEKQPHRITAKQQAVGGAVKVLFVGPWKFLPDTGYKNVKLIYPSLFEPLKGCEFHILHGAPTLPDFTQELVEKYGVKFHSVETRRDADWVKAAISVIKREGIDVITNVFFGYHFGNIAAKAAHETRCRSVVRFPANEIYARGCSNAYVGEAGKKLKRQEIRKEKDAIRLADQVIAIAPWEEKRLREQVNETQRDKIVWCMRGVDIDRYIPPEKPRNGGARKFIYAGRSSVAKGHQLIEDVAKAIASDYPDVEFYFAGQFEKGTSGNITYLGYLSPDELREVYRDMDALILPSMSEGFANVIVEAMACGLPCLITKNIHETFFTHRKNALLIDLDVEDIKSNIVDLHSDPDLMAAMQLEARRMAIEHFDEKKWAIKYQQTILGPSLGERRLEHEARGSQIVSSSSDRLRVLFISPRPYGMMGTSGIYFLADAYRKYSDFCMISNSADNGEFTTVCDVPDMLDHHEVIFDSDNAFTEILEIMKDFSPDIVTVASYQNWHFLVRYLKEQYPDPSYVLDVKSPILAKPKSKRAIRILDGGRKAARALDLVMTRSLEDIPTLIPDCHVPTLVYPLGANISLYNPVKDKGAGICRKFVYIGAIAELRKLDVLLEYIGALPGYIKSGVSFDFYGSGPYLEDFLRDIKRLGLDDLVSYKGCVDADKLPQVLSGYDAGIAWVPRDLYDSAPSLKSIEYIAAGLLPIATDTTAHCKLADEGYHVAYFSCDKNAFVDTIKTVFRNGYPKDLRNRNLELIKAHDWSRVARDVMLPRMAELRGVVPCVSNKMESGGDPAEKNKGHQVKLSKMMVISPRPFGLVSTAGTYLLADAYATMADVSMVCRNVAGDGARIVYREKNIKNMLTLDFGSDNFVERIMDQIDQFEPQVVIIYNYIQWTAIATEIRRRFPPLKIVLDIQTPLIIEGDRERYSKIQRRGARSKDAVDFIITLTRDAIKTWIPGWSGPDFMYPLGIQVGQYEPKSLASPNIICKNYVFIGSIHPMRKLDVLIDYIAALPVSVRHELSFDFYGDGGALETLKSQVAEYGLEQTIHFKGVVSSDEIALLLSGYDAGIAWVPHEVYDDSPSLKLLEYIAAGLVPLATDTRAHKREKYGGLHVELHAESQEAFVARVTDLLHNGFSAIQRDENLEKIKEYDYEYIAKHTLMHVLENVVNGYGNGGNGNSTRPK